MPAASPRVPPLPEEEWSDEVREILGRARVSDERPVFNIFRTLARHPKLLKRWLVFGAHVLVQSTLPARWRELLILRVAWLCRAEYEWAHHVEIGREVGLDDTDLARVVAGPEAAGWDPLEANLIRAADELHAEQRIGDETWQALAEQLEPEQCLDLVFTVGQYTLVSMALKTCGVPLEPGLEGFPDH